MTRCARCAAELPASAHFCTRCGTPVSGDGDAPDDADDADADSSIPVWVQGVFAVLASVAVSSFGWSVLGAPARALGSVIEPGDCTGETPGTSAMYLCSARVGFLTTLGPLLVVVAALVFRAPLRRATSAVSRRIPRDTRFVVAPVLATGLFTMAYAEIHRSTASQSGLVPQRVFPAVAGALIFVTAKAGPAITRRLPRFMAVRDRVPLWLRLPLVLLVPLLLAYVLTDQDRVTDTAFKEQIVVLVSLAVSYLAIVPRSGRLTHVLRRGVR